jgi:hypothetical protein
VTIRLSVFRSALPLLSQLRSVSFTGAGSGHSRDRKGNRLPHPRIRPELNLAIARGDH